MTKKELKQLEDLQSVCETAVAYVGSANYDYRESLARWNVRKAFDDFASGRKIEWVEFCNDENS